MIGVGGGDRMGLSCVGNHVEDPINVVATRKKNGERYCLLFDDRHTIDALRQLGLWAANDDLSFTWYDAAVLSKKVREVGDER